MRISLFHKSVQQQNIEMLSAILTSIFYFANRGYKNYKLHLHFDADLQKEYITIDFSKNREKKFIALQVSADGSIGNWHYQN